MRRHPDDYNPRLLRMFAEWAARQPPEGTYDPWSNTSCALAQFAKTVDPRFHSAGFVHWDDGTAGLTFLVPRGEDELSADLRGDILEAVLVGGFGELAARLAKIADRKDELEKTS